MPLKMDADTFEKLRQAVTPLDTEENRVKYRARDFPRADRTKDVDMRYRWDLLYASKMDLFKLFKELNDSHIDSALRQIVKPL